MAAMRLQKNLWINLGRRGITSDNRMEEIIMRGGKQSSIYYKAPGERLRYFKERNVAGEIDIRRMLMENQAIQR